MADFITTQISKDSSQTALGSQQYLWVFDNNQQNNHVNLYKSHDHHHKTLGQNELCS